jgi:vancomycin resistance protein YoaR
MKRKHLVFGSLGVAILVLLIFIVNRLNNILNYDKIYTGVFVGNVELSGKTINDAKKALENKYSVKIDNKSIPVIYEKNTWYLKYSATKMKYEYDNAVKKAYSLGRQGNYIKRLSNIQDIRKNKRRISLKLKRDDTYIKGFISSLSKKINRIPKEPTLKRIRSKFVKEVGINGVRVNEKLLNDTLVNRLDNLSTQNVKVSVNVAKPKHDINELNKVKDLLGEFQTNMHGDSGRLHNLTYAASKLNGIVMYPNSLLSLNKVLGPRTIANGFKSAPVILNNKAVQGDGGGVCQVATTLYNAVIRSQLSVEERAHHTIPSSYCALGQDATIAGDYIDFKFKNSSNAPIYIMSWTDSQNLYAKIYGYNEHPEENVEIVSDLITTYPVPATKYVYDNTLPKDYKVQDVNPQPGYLVKVYRVVKVNGKVKSNKLLSKNLYEAVAPVVRVGTKK